MQAQAVKQLGLVWRQGLRQPGRLARFRVSVFIGFERRGHHVWHGLQHRHALQHGGHFFQRRRCAQAVDAQRFRCFHHGFAIAPGQRIEQLEDIAAVHAAQHQPHTALRQAARTKSNRLVRQ